MSPIKYNPNTDPQKWVKSGPTSIDPDLTLEDFENWTVDQYPIGMVGEAGNADAYYTGAWRHEKPLWDPAICTNCMMCWINCADTAVIMENQKVCGINYNHCKGCGVCPHECRFGALKMVPEHVNHLEPEQSAEAEPEITEGA
ncbi:MAG: hypothetical protein FWE46_04030 [Coriobacteriia bacterium]|nr:hypothetical protein [Coriobacteriia bacterium]MCL2537204.1 hypothetical protein [Coriobacteriia bacterium]